MRRHLPCWDGGFPLSQDGVAGRVVLPEIPLVRKNRLGRQYLQLPYAGLEHKLPRGVRDDGLKNLPQGFSHGDADLHLARLARRK